jgi:exoribonuclease R
MLADEDDDGGIVVGELHLFSKTKYGTTAKHVPLYKFVPLRPSTRPCAKVASTYGTKHTTSTNLYVVVQYSKLSPDKATIVEILGPITCPTAGLRAIQYRYLGYIGQTRSRKAERAIMLSAEGETRNITNAGDAGEAGAGSITREDATTCLLCTVDPPNCRDIDDAISFSSDHCTVGVHIADVASFVPCDGALDRWYRAQPYTLYRPDGKVQHSLPAEFATSHCSLVAQKMRRAMSVRFTIVREPETGAVCNVAPHITEEVIVSSAQLTYEDADGLRKTHSDWQALFEAVEEWQAWLTPPPVGVAAARLDSHELIAFLMVQTNACVAQLLMADASKNKQYMLLRSHAVADDAIQLSTSRRVRYASGCASYVCTQHPVPHSALELPCYTHFTSPIRRYADLHVHRMLKAYLRNNTTCDAPVPLFQKEYVMALASDLNATAIKQHKVEIEWEWWWYVTFTTYLPVSHPQYLQGTIRQWSVDAQYGISILVCFEEAVQRRAWIRALHPELLSTVRVTEADDHLHLHSTDLGMDVRFIRWSEVRVKWWWNTEKGIRGLRFEWIEPVVLMSALRRGVML